VKSPEIEVKNVEIPSEQLEEKVVDTLSVLEL